VKAGLKLPVPRRAGITEQIRHESFREAPVIPFGTFFMRTASRNGHGGLEACSAPNP